jgi:hypothetical protein
MMDSAEIGRDFADATLHQARSSSSQRIATLARRVDLLDDRAQAITLRALADGGVVGRDLAQRLVRYQAARAEASRESLQSISLSPKQRENRWVKETAKLIRDLGPFTAPDEATDKALSDLGCVLRYRELTLRDGEAQPSQNILAHVMRAIAESGVSVTEGGRIIAAFLSEERGAKLTGPAALDGLAKMGFETGPFIAGAGIEIYPSFDDSLRRAAKGHAHADNPFIWAAAIFRIWLDVPKEVEHAVHDELAPKT